MNRILSQLLRTIFRSNLKSWEECFPYIEFAYSSTNLCPFEIVYGFIPLSPLDLIALLLSEQVNLDGKKKA